MFSEDDHTHDRRAVAVYKDSSVVDHVPSEGASLGLSVLVVEAKQDPNDW